MPLIWLVNDLMVVFMWFSVLESVNKAVKLDQLNDWLTHYYYNLINHLITKYKTSF